MFQEYLKTYRSIITENDPNNGICFDGAVDEDCYFERTERLMFLLKETNGNKNNGERTQRHSDWDYMSWVREQASGSEKTPLYRQVFRNIAMWAKMYEIYTGEKRAPDISELIGDQGLIINESLCCALRGIAIINLKKSWGTEQTDWKELKRYLVEDPRRKEILQHQIRVLKPTVVLCGGTFDLAQTLFPEAVEVKEVATADDTKMQYFEKDGIIFVDCYHPSKPGWARKESFEYMNRKFQKLAEMKVN